MSKVTVAPFGTWESPISAKMIAEKSVYKDDVLVDPVSSILYHIETRPEEGGRNVAVESGSGIDLFGRAWNARTRVQEYGGASAIVFDGTLIFSNFEDGQIYIHGVKGSTAPRKLTSNSACRFADFAVHPRNPHLIVCVMEDHTHDSSAEVTTSLVAIDASENPTRPENIVSLISGADFYSNPRFNANGTLLAWCQWNHPDMPWDGCQVFVTGIQVTAGEMALAPQRMPMTRLGGESGNVSAVQPNWIGSHTLVFSSDVSGYHNPWVAKFTQSSNNEGLSVVINPLFPQNISEDFADPSWWLGTSNAAALDDRSLLFSASKDGRHHLYVVNLDGSIKEVECPYVRIVRMRKVTTNQVVFLGTKEDEPSALIKCVFDYDHKPTYASVPSGNNNKGMSLRQYAALISLPRAMTLTIHSPANGVNEGEPRVIHVIFYPPKNPLFVGPKSEKPCAIVNVHGGPTHVESRGLNMEKQFFTSRGWAWIDVNYAGSSNYGRKYRLKGNWGITDVEDCVYAAKELSSSKYQLIDRNRIVIRGGSAGGFVALCSLCQVNPELQIFAAGTSSYGISDLQKLAEMTHKFQSWYVQKLVGGTFNEKPEVYRTRSPVFHAKNIKVPLLLLQGSLDPIVPPNQAEIMVKAIQHQGGNVEHQVFDGEAHGWREATTIEAALEREAAFYFEIFGLSKSTA